MEWESALIIICISKKCFIKNQLLCLMNLLYIIITGGISYVLETKYVQMNLNSSLTFRGPCIVTCSYNKTNNMH
jgi:hypothetical protein